MVKRYKKEINYQRERTRGEEMGQRNENKLNSISMSDMQHFPKIIPSQSYPNPEENKEGKDNMSTEFEENMNTECQKVSNTELKRMERRMRQKMKKEIKKKEKQLQREENMRQLMFPKDQKVTVIDRSVMDKLFPPGISSSSNASVVSIDAFPALGEVKISRKTLKSSHTNGTTVSSVSEKDEHKIQEPEQFLPNNEEKVTSRKPKRHDLIHIDISQFLKTADNATTMKNDIKYQKKMDPAPYCGNILDSDNPKRKRGKQRETPKVKKRSHLKAVILQDRKQRALQKMGSDPEHIQKDKSVEEKINEDKNITQESYTNESVNNPTSHETISVVNSNLSTTSPDNTKDIDKLPFSEMNINNISNNILINCDCKTYNSVLPVVEKEEKDKNCDNIALEPLHESKVIVQEEELQNMLYSKHTRKFRDYCDHMLTNEIKQTVTLLLEDIVKFQDRQFARNPLKACAKRRHVTGLKEVKKYAVMKKVKLIIIAPDLEKAPSKGGLDEIIKDIKEIAHKNEIPYVFALRRKDLGYVIKKKVPVSCVGIMNYEGTEENYKKVINAVEVARIEYRNKFPNEFPNTESSSLQTIPQDNIPEKEEVKQEETVSTEVKEVKRDINKLVVASLLAKLTEKEPVSKKEHISPFLHAIRKHSTHNDEEVYFNAQE